MFLPEKKFCPLLSTAEEKIGCSKNCMWYIPSDDTDETCTVVHCLTSLGVLIDVVENKKN